MLKLVKAIKEPRANPDYWNAQGRETIADPTMAFHTLKIITNEPSPLVSSVKKFWSMKSIFYPTLFLERQMNHKKLGIYYMLWWSKKVNIIA